MTASTTARTERHRRPSRFIQVTVSSLLLLAAPPPARADETSDMCLADSIEGQVLKRLGRLTRAREHLEQCAEAACEDAMRVRCARWRDEVRAATPVLVIRTVDDEGTPIGDAAVRLDGALIDPSGAVPVDPGPHELRAEHAGRRFVTTLEPKAGPQSVVATIDLRSSVPTRPTPTLFYFLGGASTVGLLAFGALSIAAQVQANHLDATCKPFCDTTDRPALVTTEVGADVGLGIGVAAALAATVVYLVRPVVSKEVRLTDNGLSVAF
jgi:hypothetical protein